MAVWLNDTVFACAVAIVECIATRVMVFVEAGEAPASCWQMKLQLAACAAVAAAAAAAGQGQCINC
jgi:hypothetical protein